MGDRFVSLVYPPVRYAWKLNDTETDTRSPPTQNVYHEIFDLSGGQAFHYISFEQNNDELAAKNVDIKLTIDGTAYELTGTSMDNSEIYYVYWDDIGLDPPDATLKVDNSNPIGGLVFKIADSAANTIAVNVDPVTDAKLEVKMTSAPGTNQTLVTRYRRSNLEAT